MPTTQFSVKRVFGVSLIVSLCLSAAVAIVVFLVGKFGETEIRLLLTTFTIAGFSLTGLCSSVLYDKNVYRGFALLGIVVACIGFLATIGVIWEILTFSEIWKVVFISMVASFSIGHMSLLILAEGSNALTNSILYLTIFMIGAVAMMIVIPILNDFSHMGEFYYRILGVFAVLDVLGTVLVPILRRAKS